MNLLQNSAAQLLSFFAFLCVLCVKRFLAPTATL